MLRLHAIDTAVDVLRTAHQLLGALGFCDESDVSVIDRRLQPLLRLPVGADQVALRVSEQIGAGQVETLFSGQSLSPMDISDSVHLAPTAQLPKDSNA